MNPSILQGRSRMQNEKKVKISALRRFYMNDRVTSTLISLVLNAVLAFFPE